MEHGHRGTTGCGGEGDTHTHTQQQQRAAHARWMEGEGDTHNSFQHTLAAEYAWMPCSKQHTAAASRGQSTWAGTGNSLQSVCVCVCYILQAEAELLAAITLLFERLGFTSKEVGIKVSNRKV